MQMFYMPARPDRKTTGTNVPSQIIKSEDERLAHLRLKLDPTVEYQPVSKLAKPSP